MRAGSEQKGARMLFSFPRNETEGLSEQPLVSGASLTQGEEQQGESTLNEGRARFPIETKIGVENMGSSISNSTFLSGDEQIPKKYDGADTDC